MSEIAHFRFDLVFKTGQINAVYTLLSRSQDDRLVTDFMVKFDCDRKVVGVANTLC